MKHFTVPAFWACYDKLPAEIKEQADKNYKLLKDNPGHPSLHFKKIENYYSVRVSLRYGILGIAVEEGIVWFCIGKHLKYDAITG